VWGINWDTDYFPAFLTEFFSQVFLGRFQTRSEKIRPDPPKAELKAEN
jgi:hypothetical protein